jgi:hypothetical protein
LPTKGKGSQAMTSRRMDLRVVLTTTLLMASAAGTAHAFPEMIRAGISSCYTCHHSPSGGGIVTPYGRELSSAFLRMGGETPEAIDEEKVAEGSDQLGDFDFLNGIVALPEWLNIGGDLRGRASFLKATDVNKKNFALTNADLEFAVDINRIEVVATAGRTERVDVPGVEFISRRHYVAMKPSDDMYFRAGRFFPTFGLGIADRDSAIKRDLGWGPGEETYNAEFVYMQDSYEVFIDGIFGRPDEPDLDREMGFSAKAAFDALDDTSIGINLYQGRTEEETRQVFGVNALVGIASRATILAEADFVDLHFMDTLADPVVGRAFYAKFSYELMAGVSLDLRAEQSHQNLKIAETKSDTFGLGLQAFPVAHVELNAELKMLRDPRIDSDKAALGGYFEVHYYL